MQKITPHKFSIEALNRASNRQAIAILDRIVERSVWFAQRAADARPFRDETHLAEWLDAEVRGLSREEATQLLCAHPELSPPDPTSMTQASQSEQSRLQLLGPNKDLAVQLADLNRKYHQTHGYPFVIALHAQQDLAGVIAEFENRLAADPDDELTRSLGEVVSVMTTRLINLSGASLEQRHSKSINTGPAINSKEAGV